MRATICVEDLRVDCLIGCLDPERRRAQEIRVDLCLSLDAGAAADGDDLARTHNYAALAREVGFVLREGRFRLLETASRFLLRYLMLPPLADDARPPALAGSVTITKFGALPGAARARVEVSADAPPRYRREEQPWGVVDIVDECRRLGLYRLNVAPGGVIPNHCHRRMREAEMVLGPGLAGWRDGGPERALTPGEEVAWRPDQPHGYRNPSAAWGSVLCIDSPPFEPSEEIPVPR